MRHAAWFFSTLLHPLLQPFYLTMLLYALQPVSLAAYSDKYFLLLVGLVLLYTVLFPAIFIFIRYRQSKISDLQISFNEERTIPYLFTLTMMVLLLFTFYRLKLPPILFSALLGAAFSLAATLIINLRWKISAHTVGMGGTLIFLVLIQDQLTIQSQGLIPMCLLFAGAVGTSRLILQAHNLGQVAAGYLVGGVGVAAGVLIV